MEAQVENNVKTKQRNKQRKEKKCTCTDLKNCQYKPSTKVTLPPWKQALELVNDNVSLT